MTVDWTTRGEFHNEPLTDFRNPENRQAFETALTAVRGRFGQKHPVVIGGEEIWPETTFDSINPAHPDQVIGTFGKGTREMAEQAVEAADAAFQSWRRVPTAERVGLLFRTADRIRERKHEFSAWMVYEIGKSWVEADADTAEAIDFLEYYAREMLRLDRGIPMHQHPGESDVLRYMPLGVGAIIPPWNFPLAITVGMSSAAIVAGNAIVLKPASITPKIAWEYFQALRESGLPDGVCNFLPGPGGAIGDTIVDHPKVRFIAFTGSKEVGLRIFERASKVQPGQIWLKRTILEMGGKDAIVVDETADLDAAATAIVQSAFGFQGQKCSACSRAIIVDPVYDQLVERIAQKTREIVRVGDPDQAEVTMGPVADSAQYRSVQEYITVGRGEGRLLAGGQKLEREGYFIEPTIIADVAPNARIAQEEIFGPVLAVIRVPDYRAGLAVANGTEYGLTGAFFSKDPERIAEARETFEVGNLYINRKCTGALVGVHPFGGFNMSGTDSKAGGPDYLLLFTQAKSIAEKTG